MIGFAVSLHLLTGIEPELWSTERCDRRGPGRASWWVLGVGRPGGGWRRGRQGDKK